MDNDIQEQESETVQDAEFREISEEKGSPFFDIVKSGFKNVVIVLFFWGVLNIFFQTSIVIGMSMNNTLKNGDYLFGIRARWTDISVGDVVVVKEDKKNVVKRVAGMSGDTVEIVDSKTVLVNGEAFVPGIQSSLNLKTGKWTIDDGYIFLLGDNPENSYDSRDYGQIPESSIVSKVIFRYWPVKTVGTIKGAL